MQRPNPILALLALLSFVAPSQPSSFDPLRSPDERRVKWPSRTIRISLSTSLTHASAGITPDSDVVGAVQRALNTWAKAANISFVVVSTKLQSISPATGGDGINLITVAPTAENLAIFAEGNNAARTRVFYDQSTGIISEADIAINPHLYSDDGVPLQFSTDGTAGTYDLESTLAHEIGHLLGLTHSNVIAATMQESQALNGVFGLSAQSGRTLSEADMIAVRSVYGPCEKLASVEGRILNSLQGSLVPEDRAHVWIEDRATGRLVASGLTNSDGGFTLNCLSAGDYRAMVGYLEGSGNDAESGAAADRKTRLGRGFRSLEINGRLQVAAAKTSTINHILVPPNSSPPELNPQFLGLNGELSTVAVPAEGGKKFTLYIGGQGVDEVPGSGLWVTSPFITIDPASLTLQQVRNSIPVISVEVTVSANAPAGDYSIRLQSNSGELAYLVGAITIDPRP